MKLLLCLLVLLPIVFSASIDRERQVADAFNTILNSALSTDSCESICNAATGGSLDCAAICSLAGSFGNFLG